jgi:3-dehydroquinate synthase
MNWSISTQLSVAFEIKKVKNALDFSCLNLNRKIAVVDQTVYDLYKDQFDKDTAILTIETSESGKDWDTAHRVLKFFEDQKILRRSEPVIVVGGGVLLDLVGFCCSIYRRGIPYIRIPTTLLAIVDAGVGAKTSINHFDRRNRLGSFYTPVETLIDKNFIKTQDHREISNGIAEIIKLAVVLDSQLFSLLETNPELIVKQKFQNNELADAIIDRAIAGMIQELNDNLWEHELERSVDFGHSFSPFIEMKNIDQLLHGEAVILDCLLSCCISNLRGLLSVEDLKRIFDVVKQYHLPVSHKDFFDAELLWASLQDASAHRNGNQNVPLPTAIGSYKIVNNIDFREIQMACTKMRLLT